MNSFVVLCIIALASYSASELVIEPALNELAVAVGSKQTLTCSDTSTDPSARPYWSRRSTSFQIFTETEHVGDQYTLMTILKTNSFEVSDSGTYTCNAGSVKQNIDLFAVKEMKTEDRFFYGNKTTTLACAIEIENPSRVNVVFKDWIFHNKSLYESEDKRYKLEKGNSTLIIEKPTRKDAGQYIARFELSLPSGKQDYDCLVEYTASPLVLNLVRSINLELGDRLQVHCEVKGYPPVPVIWQRNKIDLVGNDRIQFEAHNDFPDATIIITSLEYEDEGTYTCIANSTEFMESSSKSLEIRVKNPIAWVWPLIGIVAEIVVLALLIFICTKIQKNRRDKSEKQS
ncbi:neuroplastin-like [Physella acuta]|uniref:neuroplastin-like n=1 Tax=Physella acuta TaxID=109671 RepID=UPI0027DE68C2|nr:neuroplastin-like [Physella acuta]